MLASAPQRATGHAIRSALAQTHPVCEVVVVGPEWTEAARAVLNLASGQDARVRLLPVRRPGQAPADPHTRAGVRAAQYLRAALPFTTGDWLTVCSEATVLEPDFVGTLLARAARQHAELAWACDDVLPTVGDFGGALWAAPLSALAPDACAGWDGVPADVSWWARLIAAGVRTTATSAAQSEHSQAV